MLKLSNFILFVGILYTTKGDNGLPFNLPNSSSCDPCNNLSQTSRFGYKRGFDFSTINDDVCFHYLLRTTQNVSSMLNLRRMYTDMLSHESDLSWVLSSYINAKHLFEDYYNEPYTYFVYVKDATGPNCIHVYQGGRGFPRYSTNATDDANKLTPSYLEGIDWEYTFFSGVVNYWAMTNCNGKEHENYKNASKHAFLKEKKSMESWRMQFGSRIFSYKENALEGELERTEPSGTCRNGVFSAAVLSTDCENEECTSVSQKTTPKPAEAILAALWADLPENSEKKDSSVFLINEFFIETDSRTNTQFIELRVITPSKKKSFNMVKVIAFGAISNKLVFVASLHGQRIPENGYYVINEASTFHHAADYGTFAILPIGEKEPIVLCLLQKNTKSTNDNWRNIQLRKHKDGWRSVDITAEISDGLSIFDVIKHSIIDGHVYGKQINQFMPKHIINLLQPRKESCNFILPLPDPSNALEKTYSLNLCLESENLTPYQYSFIKLGNPTPGNPNDCSRDEYQIKRMEHSPSLNHKTVGVTEEPQSAQQCPCNDPVVGKILAKIEAEFLAIKTKYNPKYDPDFYPFDKFFKTQWEHINREGFQNVLPSDDIRPFEVVPSSSSLAVPKHTQNIRCQLCFARFKKCPHTVSRQQKTMQMCSEAGQQLKTSEYRNQYLIERHLSTHAHLYSVLYAMQDDRRKFAVDQRERYLTDKTPEENQLANVFDVTYTFLRTNTAPTTAPIWFKTLEKINANIGKAYRRKESSFRIIKFLADEAMTAIVTYLTSSNSPFVLILDGSTDRTNKHVVMIYIQALEGDLTIPYFLGTVELTVGFTAEAYLDGVLEKFSSFGDDFMRYFSRNLVGIATDSAAVMKKFHRLVETWTSRQSGTEKHVVSIMCLAHKLQLAGRSALVPLKTDKELGENQCLRYFEEIERFMQTSYVWIKSSGKRLGEYRNMIIEGNERVLDLSEVYTQRWISAEYRTIRNFISSWKRARLVVYSNVDDRAPRRGSGTPIEVIALQQKFTDKNVLAIIHFLLDFAALFKAWSEYLQTFTGLIIDQYPYYEKLLQNIEEVRNFRGAVLTKFLRNCDCGTTEVGCTLEEYEASHSIVWDGMQFDSVVENGYKLSQLVPPLMEKVLKRLEFYIPEKLIKSANVLNPIALPPSVESLKLQYPVLSDGSHLRIYGKDEITYFSQVFDIELDQLLIDWAHLIEKLVRLDNWSLLRTVADANVFWSMALSEARLPWTELTKKFVRNLKVLAPGSAICETGFSIYNSVKSQRRTRLSDPHLESILQIVINGPSDIEFFDSFKYANKWKEQRNMQPHEVKEDTSDDFCETPTETDLIADINVADSELQFDFDESTETNTMNVYPDLYQKLIDSEDYKTVKDKFRFRSLLV